MFLPLQIRLWLLIQVKHVLFRCVLVVENKSLDISQEMSKITAHSDNFLKEETSKYAKVNFLSV